MAPDVTMKAEIRWPWARPKARPAINRKYSERGRPPRKSTFYWTTLFYFGLISDLLDLKNGSSSKFQSFWWYREVCTTKIIPFHKKSMIQRVGGWRARRNSGQTENKTPKQNGSKPGRWVGLDPFAQGHNKTIKNRHLLSFLRVWPWGVGGWVPWRLVVWNLKTKQSKIIYFKQPTLQVGR